jgi:hypothetical protein
MPFGSTDLDHACVWLHLPVIRLTLVPGGCEIIVAVVPCQFKPNSANALPSIFDPRT